MRIVHIAPFYHPVIGGVEEVVKRVAENAAFKGDEVYVVTYNRLRVDGVGSLHKEEVINNVHVIRLKPNIMWSHGTYSVELPDVLRRLRPDLVHVHVWRHPHVFQVAWLKKRLKFKAILHPHAPFHRLSQLGAITWVYHRLVDLLLKKSINVYDAIIALTPYEEVILVRNLGVEKEKIHVIPNGVSEEFLATEHANFKECCRNGKIILYVGRISQSKNVSLLVKAMSYVQKYIPAKLLIIGPDEGLVKRLKAYSIKKRVNMQYLGQLSGNELKKIYQKCGAFGHPAIYEPFGITLLEAQAFGKPCVITGWGGQLYVAPPNITSLYAESNPIDFGKKILALLTDESLYKRLSTNARKWAARFSWSKILPMYENLYDQLCG